MLQKLHSFFKLNIANFDYFYYILLFIIVLVGIFLRVKIFCLNASFWTDEASLALNVLNKKYIDLFLPLNLEQVAPPLFTIFSKIILNFCLTINSHLNIDLILRILPLISAVISLPLFALALYKAFDSKYITLFGVFMLAFNKHAISYAQEYKQYGVELLFSIILFLIFYCFDFKKYSAKKIFACSLFFSIAPWFAYSSVFVLFAGFLLFIVEIIKEKINDKTKLCALFFPFAISMSLFVVHFKVVSSIHRDYMNEFWTVIQPAFFNFQNFFYMFLNKTSMLLKTFDLKTLVLLALFLFFTFVIKNNFKKNALIVTSVLLIAAAYFLIQNSYIKSFLLLVALFIPIAYFVFKNNYKINLLVLVPILLVVMASFLHKYPYEPRLVLFLLPFIIMFMTSFLFTFKNISYEKYFLSLFLLFGVFVQINLSTESRLYHPRSARNFAEIIKAQDPNSDNYVVGNTSISLYYLKPYLSKNKLIMPFYMEDSGMELKQSLEELPKGEIIWLYAPHVNISPRHIPVFEYRDKIKNDSHNFEFLEEWTDKDGFLLKYKKI